MLKRLFCCAALLGLVSCVDPNSASGSTGDTTLYVYDNANKRVLFWGDLPKAYDSGTFTTPTATLTTNFFNNVTPLAWGGMAMDPTRNRLYLVGETGNIVRLDSVRSLTGSIASTDVVTFKLDTSVLLSGGKFGQISVDSSNDTLYVTENGTTSTRIWVVGNASARSSNATVALQELKASGDTGGYGVAAHGGLVYGSFTDGDSVGTSPVLTGYRLRKGAGLSFDPNQVLLGDQTGLGSFATLALDHSNGILYTGVSAVDFPGAADPVLAFKTGQFGGSYNQAPDHIVGDITLVTNLRVLAHAGNKDWLVGLSASGDETLWIWKSPSSKANLTFKELVATSGSQFRGAALDGAP